MLARMSCLTPAIKERTRANRSIITRSELLEDGATSGQIQHWQTTGCLDRLHRAVYAPGGAAITPTAQVDAAVRRAGTAACAGGASALALWGLDGFELADERDEHQPFVIVPPWRSLQGVPFDWAAVEVPDYARTTRYDIPTVIVAEGLVQAAGQVKEKMVRVGFDDGVRRHLTSGRELEQVARRLHGVLPGAPTILKMIEAGTLQLESEGERELAQLFGPEDPQPVWQVRIDGYRVDALFVEARLALEYQGKQYHRSEADRRADRERAATLKARQDIEIIEVTAADLANPVALRDRILAARTQRLRAGIAPLRGYTVATR